VKEARLPSPHANTDKQLNAQHEFNVLSTVLFSHLYICLQRFLFLFPHPAFIPKNGVVVYLGTLFTFLYNIHDIPFVWARLFLHITELGIVGS
jgi:hypothetical protein